MGLYLYDADHTMTAPANSEEIEIRFSHMKIEDCSISEVLLLEDCSIIDEPKEDIIIPNVFSPNNDGQNDSWQIQVNNGSIFLSCHIYDRWGNLIYVSKEGQLPIWDGKKDGVQVVQGVYICQVVFNDSDNENKIKVGDITVLR